MLTDELINNIEALSTDPTITALCQELRLYRAFYVARMALEQALNKAGACRRGNGTPEQQLRVDQHTAYTMRAVEQSIIGINNYKTVKVSK